MWSGVTFTYRSYTRLFSLPGNEVDITSVVRNLQPVRMHQYTSRNLAYALRFRKLHTQFFVPDFHRPILKAILSYKYTCEDSQVQII